jgi:Mrp family chromosome partitioning ATPase
LVEKKASKYMDMLGVCRCPHCTADVKALALSNLPPKYIVVPQSQLAPLEAVYEGKYSAAITVQLLAACKTVLDHPHH